MDNRSSYDYVKIGLILRLLRNITSNSKKSFVVKELNTLKDGLETVGFEVSCSNLNTTFYGEVERELLALADDDLIGSNLQRSLADEMMVLERHVLSEGITKKVHVIPERRFNSNYLLNEQEKLFKAGVFSKLSELAIYDIKSSCRCILFGESTASAFHILRATEEVLKLYYFHHRKQKRLKKPMWAAMLNELKAKTKNKPPIALIKSLDLIRESYRNPTQHPDAVYEIDGAQDLFGLCLDVIGKMADELEPIT